MMKKISTGFRKRLSTILTLSILAAFLIAGGSRSEAATGSWRKNSKGYWYSYSDGSYAKNAWVKWSGKWYYFGASGYMQKGWKKISNKWYYFGKDGAMRTGWQKIGGKWYFLKDGAMQTGWQKISGTWYYFGKSGAMQTGWIKSSRKWYFCDTNGKMVTGKKTIGGIQFSFSSNGNLTGGWQDYYIKKIKQFDKENGRERSEYALVYVDNDDVPELYMYDSMSSSWNTSEDPKPTLIWFNKGQFKEFFIRTDCVYIPKNGLVLDEGPVKYYLDEVSYYKFNDNGYTTYSLEYYSEQPWDYEAGPTWYENGKKVSKAYYEKKVKEVHNMFKGAVRFSGVSYTEVMKKLK